MLDLSSTGAWPEGSLLELAACSPLLLLPTPGFGGGEPGPGSEVVEGLVSEEASARGVCEARNPGGPGSQAQRRG